MSTVGGNLRKFNTDAQLQTFPYLTASTSFLYSSVFMVKSGTEDGTCGPLLLAAGPLLCAKFHPIGATCRPCGASEKPQTRPLSKLNNRRFALCAMLLDKKEHLWDSNPRSLQYTTKACGRLLPYTTKCALD